MLVAFLAALVAIVPTPSPASPPTELPVVEVVADDTVIDRSCRLRIAAGRVIVDAADDGVVKIVAPDVVVEFEEGSVLAGAAAGLD
ncbi:MAG: hypothetical protein RL689_2210, partial [Planctomycetota bacterium]